MQSLPLIQLVNASSATLCALCLQPRELRKSHVIPEFVYESLYDEKHRFHVLSIIPDKSNSLEQKGIREPLLCDECEQKFSIWERYASLVLKGGVELSSRREGNIIFIGDLDYKKFRLFQLSVLWRAGISSLQFFENVNLGCHKETLRRLLLDEDPGVFNRYGCLMFGLKVESAAFTQLIMQPGRLKLQGHTAYRFVFGGFMWVFLVSSHSIQQPLSQAVLKPNNTAMLIIRDAVEMQNLVMFSEELARMGRRI